MTLLVRTTGEPTALGASVRELVHQIDPLIPLQMVRPLDDDVSQMMAGRRLNTTLFVMFGAIAALLAAVGIYGVVAGSVELRTRELGVRLALGATGGAILRMVLAEGLWLVILGLVLGLGASLALSGVIAGLLYDVRPTDAATFAGIATFTVVVALIASLIPAVRALRVDPVTALRAE
jgi:putative ABC transport system permease protein